MSGIVFGGFCAFIANEKNRNSGGWFFLGFLFNLIALLALIAVPKVEKAEVNEPIKRPEWYDKPVQKPSNLKKSLVFSFFILTIIIVISLWLNS